MSSAGASTGLPGVPRVRRSLKSRPSRADVAFRRVATASGLVVLGIMLLVGGFLAVRAGQAIGVAKLGFLTESRWEPDAHAFGIKGLLLGTILIGLVALLVAFPLALGTALYISEIAPRWLERTLISLVDLMAAVPSVVFGLWGFFFLQNHVSGLSEWISIHFSWFPPLRVTGADPDNPLHDVTLYKSSTFIAGIVVGLMVTPIMTSVMREAFSQAPIGEREAAYGLGATRWGMIRAVVIPFGKGGMIGGSMLGLGRALGETIAVYMILSLVVGVQGHILQNGGSSVSALIALRFGDSSAFATSALMAAGFALFLMTLVINFIAASVVARSRSGAESS